MDKIEKWNEHRTKIPPGKYLLKCVKGGKANVWHEGPLFEDLKGISRSHLGDNPETKFYRLNALSYVVSGFSKYRPISPLKSEFHSSGMKGWQL